MKLLNFVIFTLIISLSSSINLLKKNNERKGLKGEYCDLFHRCSSNFNCIYDRCENSEDANKIPEVKWTPEGPRCSFWGWHLCEIGFKCINRRCEPDGSITNEGEIKSPIINKRINKGNITKSNESIQRVNKKEDEIKRENKENISKGKENPQILNRKLNLKGSVNKKEDNEELNKNNIYIKKPQLSIRVYSHKNS
ncbi:MAG: hypothetical protein MJ252_28835 [archaeon]|nr:hypothetical protein [archaeon]